jgi:hypothetical protein
LKDSILNGIFYLYADECSVFYQIRPGLEILISNLIQQDMDRLAQWSDRWKLEFKASKSCEVVFHTRPINLKVDIIPKIASHKHLG